MLFTAAALLTAPALADGNVRFLPSAAAEPCPDVEVSFARGRDEPPGPGAVGQAFEDALKTKTGKDIGTYAVVYPAQTEVGQGVDDMTHHIESMVSDCPNTRLVVGGYSMGAAVTNAVLNTPLPPAIDQHIVAVVTFGNASKLVGVPTSVGPQDADKTIDQCNTGDPICSDGQTPLAHWQLAYIGGGPVTSAVDFTAGRL